MILRESRIPEQKTWDTFFTPMDIIKKFGIEKTIKPIADIGCGYGTFTIPLAQTVNQTIYAVDIENKFLETIKSKKKKNIQTINYDVFENELTLPENVGSILLFNILHNENPNRVVKNVLPNLSINGKIYVIHWRSDIETLRGPPLNIRPKPEDIINQFETIGFEKVDCFYNISQYHYGLTFQRRVQ